jgi:hypothetical protein
MNEGSERVEYPRLCDAFPERKEVTFLVLVQGLQPQLDGCIG